VPCDDEPTHEFAARGEAGRPAPPIEVETSTPGKQTTLAQRLFLSAAHTNPARAGLF